MANVTVRDPYRPANAALARELGREGANVIIQAATSVARLRRLQRFVGRRLRSRWLGGG